MMSDVSKQEGPSAPGGIAFPTTRWSLVVHAGAPNHPEAQGALESLCRLYWYPLYAFARRQGRAHHEAEDRTQEFLSGLIGRDTLSGLSPERGRFRAFLLTALRHFLVDEWRSAQAEKRGGGQVIHSFNMQSGEDRFSHEPPDPSLTPEQAFDRAWAGAMCDGAMDELGIEYAGSGRSRLFEELRPMILTKDAPGAAKTKAARLGMNEHAFTVALHRIRRRFGERLRQRVADTVNNPALVNDELRHLLAAMSSH
jgi:DNA-directed RNA polymerase specialized sigma24 family protein